MTSLDTALAGVRDAGRKALVPYVVGGLSDDWLDVVRAVVHAGADLVEIGVPFSDPMMDGAVIQRASDVALARGATLATILDDVSRLDVDVPLVVMTYFNIFHHHGLERSALDLRAAGVSGTIVPDLSLEESGPWRTASNNADEACVLMVAPSSPRSRVRDLAQLSQGFVYAAARMAVTGAAGSESHADRVVSTLREFTSTPVYVGIGIATPEQAATAAKVADGVIVGAALVQRLLDGGGPKAAEEFVAQLRHATT